MTSHDKDHPHALGSWPCEVGALVILINSVIAGVSGIFLATRSVAVAFIAAMASVSLVALLIRRLR